MLYDIYVGTYTQKLPHVDGKGAGIYHFQFDGLTGENTPARLAARMNNPSYLIADKHENNIYAVSETDHYRRTPGGAVVAFAIQSSGRLQRLNSRPSGGGSPCHLALTQDGKSLLCANYTGGSLGRLTIQSNGSLGVLAQTLQHKGHGANPARQEAAHVHSSLVDPSGKWVFVADLGTDNLVIYQQERYRRLLHKGNITLPAGSGPRHMALHPNGAWLYVVGELDSTLHTLSYDPISADCSLVGTDSTLPAGFADPNTAAHVAIHPNRRFIYVSNRGHNSLAVFRVGQDGGLAPAGHFFSQGLTPRHFTLLPGSSYLLAANQDSDTVDFVKLDPDTGLPEVSRRDVAVPSPVCLLATLAKRTR